MNKHASINRAFRLVWNVARAAWVPAAETTRRRGKRASRAVRYLTPLVGALAVGQAFAANPNPTQSAAPLPQRKAIQTTGQQAYTPPAPTTLPTGGTVVAGSATISASSSSTSAVLTVNQSSERAVIDWTTFNLGSAAQVLFAQPNKQAVTLDKVLGGSPSEIFGKITAPGQVFLVNPSGIYFGKSASVDVGGLVATTNDIDNADFMSGNITFKRNGATGSVINDGTLQSSLGGYIALLAPEVRNGGVVIARMGTVAMAAGDAITLDFDGQHLAGITAQPSTVNALVENRSAVIAPGGLIILSAKAVDSLQGGVVRNSGTLEATGMSSKGGRIVLEASTSVENTGTISANAGADGSPAGDITITAPTVTNSGSITATGATTATAESAASAAAVAGGHVAVSATTFTQTSSGLIDVSGSSGGSVTLEAVQDIDLSGTLSAAGIEISASTSTSAPTAQSQGGSVTLASLNNVTLQNALIDVSGAYAAGRIDVSGGGSPAPSDPPADPPVLALLGTTELNASSRRGRGGTVTLTAAELNLLDSTAVDATGATGGGDVYVGGGFHGQDPSIADAQLTTVAGGVSINASATQSGDGGQVVLWSSEQTSFAGSIEARGGAVLGSGGTLEVSGAKLDFTGSVNAGAPHGTGGSLLLDPDDITIVSGGSTTTSNPAPFSDQSNSTLDPSAITNITNTGTSVTLQANDSITINSTIQANAPTGTTGGALIFQAGGSIRVNASVISDNGNITFSVNDSGATLSQRTTSTATFVNNSLISAGTGSVTIDMGTLSTAGNITTGHITAANLTINDNATPAQQASQTIIDLDETDLTSLTGALNINASAANPNLTNSVGTVSVHGPATINVGTGNITITNPNTDFTQLGITGAGAVDLVNANAIQFATTNVASLTETTQGPIAQTSGSTIQVSGATILTTEYGGFGFADPYINLTNSGNHFGSMTLDVPNNGGSNTGGYATIADSGSANITSTTTSYLQLQAGGSITTGTIGAGGAVTLTAQAGSITTGMISAGGTATLTAQAGPITTGTISAGGSATLSAQGAVSLGQLTAPNLTVDTGGAGTITTTGAITVGGQTTLTAGATNDITLGNPGNSLNYVQLVSGKDVTLVDTGGITFGQNCGCEAENTISGSLNVTAGGTITQVNSPYDGYSQILVTGPTTFTASNANSPIQLILGYSTAASDQYSGEANSFGGGITLLAANLNTGFNDVYVRNTSANATSITGLTSVGTLDNVALYYDNALSLTLPAMTVTGALSVYAPSVANTSTNPTNTISQSGPITVGGEASFQAASTGDILLNLVDVNGNPVNNFNQFLAIGNNVTVKNNAPIVLMWNTYANGNMTVTANGNISDQTNGGATWTVAGTLTLDPGPTNDINLSTGRAFLNTVVIPEANNATVDPLESVTFGNVSISGSLVVVSGDANGWSYFSVGQLSGTSITMPLTSTATFANFGSGIALTQSGNRLGPLAISNCSTVDITEDAPITQASAWNSWWGGSTNYTITLTTTNDQAIELSQSNNNLGPLILTQLNAGATSAGAVDVVNTGNNQGLTQAGAWSVAGQTTLDSGSYSIDLNNPNNVLGPLNVIAAGGTTNGSPSTVVIYAKNTATSDAITDVNAAGAWSIDPSEVVELVAYDSTGTTEGGGNVTLTNQGNVLGPLYIKANNVTITESGSITDGPVLNNWDGVGDEGWATTGSMSLVVVNPAGKTITLSNIDNLIGPIALSTTITSGGPEVLNSVLITDNENLTQNGVWNVGSTPVTLDARTNQISLPNTQNVMGAISIQTDNGTPTSVAITENNPISQGSPWVLPTVPVTLIAENGNSITLTSPTNIMGNLTVTGGAVSITENGPITQGAVAWDTTGTTTLDPTTSAIILTTPGNILGPIAIGGTPTAVSITEAANITQASAWIEPSTPFTLNSGSSDIVLSQPQNQLGELTLTGQNATVVENNSAGIVAAAAWNIPGTTTLTAGSANPIILDTTPASNLGTLNIQSASYADIYVGTGGVNFSGANISSGGTLTVSSGGAITQTGAIVTPSLLLIGTGSATLTNSGNTVSSVAAGFSGGNLQFTNSSSFAVSVVGGTSGITIDDGDVTLTSVSGTVTGLTNINASSGSLTLTTGTALSLPQMAISGPQTYTAGGSGITLMASVTSTAAGAITFNSPVTLAADLAVQSTNSPITFTSTVAGNTNQLTVNAGSGAVQFTGAVSALGQTTDASAALSVTSSGANFASTVAASNGLAITGPVTFNNTVTLGDGDAGSIFSGRVTLGAAGGMSLSGYVGMNFDNGVLLQNGPATINSNNAPLNFSGGTVSGPYALTLNSGTALLTGLNLMGSALTGLTVTALDPTIPAGGISIAGPQAYTATSNSDITLQGNLTSTAPGAITFNSPVSVGAAVTVASTNAPISFVSTVDGNQNLTVNSGTNTTTFGAAVGGISVVGSGTGAALILSGTGATTFDSTVQARSGISAAGPVTFEGNVTLADGDTGSTFSGLVTSSAGSNGNTISGYDGIAFNGGLTLAGGPTTVVSNGSTIGFAGAVSGVESLALNAASGGTGTVTGLNYIGAGSDLTGLTVTGQTLSLPSTGLAVDGPMSFTAAGGITLNGAVGNTSAPATGAVSFNSPVTLATGAVAVSTANAPVTFAGTVDGAEALTVNSGTAATTFSGAVGSGTALTSLTVASSGATALNGGSVNTTGAQSYDGSVTLGANSTLTGDNVQFDGTLDGTQSGVQTLTVNDSGTTTFDGVVGGNNPLASLYVNAPDAVTINTSSITTTGSQTYIGATTLASNTTLTGQGITFDGTVDGAHALIANAGSGTLSFEGAIGAVTPLTQLTASANTIDVGTVTTTGSQSYDALVTLNLGGALSTTDSSVTIIGPTTLTANSSITTTGGAIDFSGAVSTIDGDYDLTLAAGAGDITLGGVVGGVTPLAGISMTGNDLSIPDITTVNGANQTYTALDDITLTQSRTVNAPVSFTADSDNNGSGTFILPTGVSLTASNSTLSITAADIDLEGSSTLSSGTGLMTLTATDGRNIYVGGSTSPVTGQMTITGNELSRMFTSGGLQLNTTGAGWIEVNGIASAESQNVTGTLALDAHGTGNISFITAPSTFDAVTADATGGPIDVGVNLTGSAIQFITPVTISGASTVRSTGGNITFDNTVAVANDLTLSTANGAVTFGGTVSSTGTLTLNLGGGSVSGLSELQSTLTGLTVNGTGGITLPALTINGPQVYDTGPVTVTGNLSGIGLTFDNLVNVVPTSGTAITLNANTGVLAFNGLASFNAINMSLVADSMTFSGDVSGTGALTIRPFTGSTNISVANSGATITGLNLTAAEVADLPLSTLSSLTIGSSSGTGWLDIAGALNVGSASLTLNGGGGITQSGGAIKSGALTLYAAGHAIDLPNAANSFGAVGLNGAPSAVTLTNTQDITQQGTAGWNLGSADLTLNAGTHDITLTHSGNTFGTVSLTGGNAQLTEAAAADIGASSLTGSLTVISTGAVTVSGALAVTGNVSLTATGAVTQSAPLTIGGNLDVVTTVNAGDVTINNSGATATTLGNTEVGGDYTLTATNEQVSQAAGTSVQVAGNLTVTGAGVTMGGAGNLIGGTTSLPASNTTVIQESGVITLAAGNYTGSLTVISDAANRTFGSSAVTGNAIVLNNASNNVGGTISVSASPPTIDSGAEVQTGINQSSGSLSVAGTASFTAEASTAGSLGIHLTNSGNSFGNLQLSGTTVAVNNASTGLTTLGNSAATTSMTLTTAGAVAQSGAISTPFLTLSASGPVTLSNSVNSIGTANVTSNGGAITLADSEALTVAGINAGGASVSLSTTGNLTQTGALQDVSTLGVDAGGSVTLTDTSNSLQTLAASTAGTGFQLYNGGGALAVSGAVTTAAGDMTVRTVGNLTLNSGGVLTATTGNIYVSTEEAGNFINDSSAAGAALVTGTGDRWLVYSDTPDLVAGAHTVKGGLTSSFRYYDATYSSYGPSSVTQSGNGFIYDYATPTLTIGATIIGTPSQVYGSTPTATLGYTIVGGLVDSEDNVSNVITGGTATYNMALTNTLNAGAYTVKYVSGLTSSYSLVVSPTGPTYTVTPAVLTYTADSASRAYGAVSPTLDGSISGFVLGQTAATALTGSPTWTTTATSASNVGQYAITGGGYVSNGNYTFAQAPGNATALTINPAALTVTAENDTITYDGLNFSGGNGVTYSGFVNGDGSSALTGALTYTGTSQGARNAGIYTITPSGLTTGNYQITYDSGALTINKADLDVTTSNVTKTYDGTLIAIGTPVVTGGTQLFGSDSLSAGTYAFTNANAGSADKTVTVTGVTVSDGNSGGNYNVTYVNNTASTINPASLTVEAASVTKTYDGTTAATSTPVLVSGTLYTNASNGNVQDSLGGGTYAFADPNAGIGNKAVTASGVTINDGNGGGNYTIAYVNNTTSTINPAELAFTGTVADKTYDGTTAATVSGYTLTGFVGDQTLVANVGSASFQSANAGTQTVDIGGITLANGTNGGLASNYTVNPASTATATVDPKPLTVSAVVANKVYDGTTNATVESYGLSGFVGDQTVTAVYAGDAAFATKNVGTAIPVSITGIELTGGTNGGLASNYTVASTVTSSANITPASLQIAGLIIENKVYDGTTTAYFDTANSALSGLIGTDQVQLGSLTGTFATKNVGNNITIGAGTVVLTGTDAMDYTLIQPTGLTADITPRPLTVTASGVNKVYNGTTNETVTLNDDPISGDSVNVSYASANFLDKNVGNGKYVAVSGITMSGADAEDYTVNTTTSTFANITPPAPPPPTAPSTVSGTWSLQPVQTSQSLADAPAVAQPSAGTVAATPPPSVLDMGDAGGSALVNTGATSDGATGSSTDLTGGSASSAPPNQGAIASGAPAASSATAAGTTNAATMVANASQGSNAASGPTATVGSNMAESVDNTTPSGSNTVDNVMSGVLPGASPSPLVSTDDRITVSIVQAAANTPLSGLITVSVPRSVIDTAIEFRFPLPQQLMAKLHSSNQEARVTLMNGKPLPRWLTFRPSAGVFAANGMPMRGLPLEVMVHTGTGNWAVLISETND